MDSDDSDLGLRASVLKLLNAALQKHEEAQPGSIVSAGAVCFSVVRPDRTSIVTYFLHASEVDPALLIGGLIVTAAKGAHESDGSKSIAEYARKLLEDTRAIVEHLTTSTTAGMSTVGLN